MSTNTMMGRNVTATRDASGNVTGLSAGGGALLNPSENRVRRITAITSAIRNAVSNVMQSPPTITVTTTGTSTITDRVHYPSVVNALPAETYTFIGLNMLPWATSNTFLLPHINGTATSVTLHKIIFYSDAAEVECRCWMNASTKIQIRVDGELIGQSAITSASGGATHMIHMEFSDARVRRFELVGSTMPFGGVNVPPGGTVWAASVESARPLLVAFGDSYTNGTGADSPDQSWFATVARLLGFDYYADGRSDSGFLTASPNDPVSRINARLPIISGGAVAAVLIALGYNDMSGDQSVIAANCAAAIDAARAMVPHAPILMIGPWTPNGVTGNLAATADTVATVAESKSAYFIDIEDFVNAANAAVYTGVDTIHPNPAGHVYLGNRIAELINPFIP